MVKIQTKVDGYRGEGRESTDIGYPEQWLV